MTYISTKVFVSENIKPLFYTEDLPEPLEDKLFTGSFSADTLNESSETCPHEGLFGHLLCGICRRHKVPRVECGCLALCGGVNEALPLVKAWSDGSVLEVESERIIGLNLEMIPGLYKELDQFLFEAQSFEVCCHVEVIVKKYLLTLVQWGCLYRDSLNFGAWTYRRAG